jgi:methylglutaconyl-CoA hydratase
VENGTIALVSFNRPEAKNAISKQLLNDLHDYVMKLTTAEESVASVHALVLTSALPSVFCAGADLKERKTFTSNDTAMFLRKLNYTLDLIADLPITTISSIQGVALGGGLEIALATDFRVLSETAQLGLPETRLAIIPGAGGTKRLPHIVGQSRALDMILTGRRISAQEALTFGLANRVGAEADKEALALATTIGNGGPLAIRAAKEAVKGASSQWERVGYRQVVNSRDKFEALDAFISKRSPHFIGE